MADSNDTTMEEPASTSTPVEAPATPMAEDATATQDTENLPPPRLMITKMELENFKSYAGVKEIGPFHKCFSAVVGPNGSGKSNVIDAMLFVFGKRAKKLRLNKVSELIHKSDAVKDDPPSSARVSVFFQEIIDTGPGDTDYIIVPDSGIEVTRIARKDSSSTYKLDGKTCQFKVVSAYLASKGIDLDNNRFLILQGEVEMISMMAPKGKTENDEGLLEYLEDIIGSSKYVEETTTVAEKVEALTDLRQEKLNRVKAVEKEKDALESAKLEAEALLGKEREIRRKQNILYQIHAMKAEQEAEHYTGKKTKAEQVLQAERERLGKANERVHEIESGLSEQRKEYEKIYDELKETKEEFAAYERRDIKLREELKHGKAQKKKLETKATTETKKEEDAIAKGEAAEESIPEFEQKIEELVELNADEDGKLEQIYEDMKGVTQKLRSELEQKTQELAPVNQERAVFQADLDTAETEVKLLEDSTTRAKEKLVAAEEELATLDQKQESKCSELKAGEDELTQSKTRIVDAQAEEKVLAEKEGSISKRNQQLLARSEEAKAALQSKGGGGSAAVQGILKATKKGGELSNVGVLGRLGDLAKIPEEYDVAVSTACGMLDHIVVQTTAGAQRCLEFLRKHGLGRANFIPLDKMKKGAHDRKVETPEGAPRLFELIAPTNFAVTSAIFLAVGDTLVAPDLETATRWAYDFRKRWRVVSMDGKLIETAGTMSGGGKSVRRGGMRLANARSSGNTVVEQDDDSNDCQQLEAEAAKAQAFLQECRTRRKEVNEEIRALVKRVKVLEVKLPKLAMEIAGCDTTREELTKRIPELKSQSELSDSDAAKLVELSKNVHKCKTEMSSCAILASKLEADVARLQKAILDAGGSKLKKQQAACEKALSSLNATEKALNSAKVAITSSQKAAAKARDAKSAAEVQLDECKATLEEKVKEFKSLEEDALHVLQSYEKVKEVEAEKKEALDAVTKECEVLRKAQSEVKCVEIELLGHIEAFDKQIVDCNNKIQHWTKEVSKLRAVAEEDDDLDLSDDEGEEEDVADAAPSLETSQGSDDDAKMEDAEVGSTDIAPEELKQGIPKISLPKLSFAALDKFDKDVIKESIDVLETERNTIAKNANMGAIAEYRKKEADYLTRVSELDTVTEERNDIRKTFEELRRQRLEMFMDGFGQITLKLKEMYQMITLGGDAELELVDSLDPFSEGIVFSVRPPKKSWKNISNLSGGEKTLSSLALVFALHHFKPTPLYVMDEIDAALDFKNVSIVANYIKERTKNAQFIIISLRNNMFELADRLVGIYKTDNCTKSVTINPRAFGVTGQQNGLAPATPALAEKTNSQNRPSSAAKDSRRRVSYQSDATSTSEVQ